MRDQGLFHTIDTGDWSRTEYDRLVVGIRTDTGNEKVRVNAGGSIEALAPGEASPAGVLT
jgi:hypothetical protein